MKLRAIVPPTLLSIALILGAACVKRAEPPAPEVPASEMVERALTQAQEDLEKLRMTREASASLLQQAQESLEKAREFAKAGQGEKAYEQVLTAQKQIQSAKAAAALAGGKESPDEASKKIQDLKSKAGEPVRDLGVKISRAEAERAIGEVSRRLVKAREIQKELDAQVSKAEKLLEEAKAALGQGAFDKAYNSARKAGKFLDDILAGARSQDADDEPVEKLNSWVVVRGDNLWDIAEDPRVYGDPILWPFIYKANLERIKNPDLILVGWKLKIPRGGVSRKGLRDIRTEGSGDSGEETDAETQREGDGAKEPELGLPEGEVLLETERSEVVPTPAALATQPPTPVPPTPVPPTAVPEATKAPVVQAATAIPTATPVPPTHTATWTPVPPKPAVESKPPAPADDLESLLDSLESPAAATPVPPAPALPEGKSATPVATAPVKTTLPPVLPPATPVSSPGTQAEDLGLDDLLKELDLPPIPDSGGNTVPADLELPEL